LGVIAELLVENSPIYEKALAVAFPKEGVSIFLFSPGNGVDQAERIRLNEVESPLQYQEEANYKLETVHELNQ